MLHVACSLILSRDAEQHMWLRGLVSALNVLMQQNQISSDMKFPMMWYMRPAKAETSLRIRTVRSEPLLVT